MANSKSSSTTSSTGGSTSNSSSSTNGSSSSQGGSTSHSSTSGQSHTSSSTVGGSHSYSEGKSWASGKVEENTQANRDKYNQDYTEGQKVTDAYNKLQEIIDNKPTFESQYQSNLDSLYDQIMNRDKFNYDFNADQMYQMYKDNYTKQGEKAMQDTMGQASAMTGGYGSSYAQSVGQQTYQNYLQELNNIIPTLRDDAYQQYKDEGDQLNNQYNITSDAYNREYGQYRDNVSDWQSDRGFQQGVYSDERNFDYGQFTDNRNYWNNEYWNEKNAEHSNYQVTDTNYWENTESDTKYSSETNGSSSSWDKGQTSSNSIGSTIASNYANSMTNAASTSSGSGSSSSGSNKTSTNSFNAFSGTGSSYTPIGSSTHGEQYKGENTASNTQKATNFGAYNIKGTDTLSKYDKDGIVDDLVEALKDTTTEKERQEIYDELKNGFDYKYAGHTVTLTNSEIQFLQEKAFGKK